MFAAGGTGGHLYPAMALAEEIRRNFPGYPIAFTGTPDHLEAQVVPRAGYPFHPIALAPMPRRSLFGWGHFARLQVRGFRRARDLLQKLEPRVVVGCGAYVSVPAVFAAKSLRIPILIAESNGSPGLANRLLGWLADVVAVSIPGTEKYFPPGRAICLGNPIRRAFLQYSRSEARRELGFPPTAHMLLVTGGSLGAKALNEALIKCLPGIMAYSDWSVMHVAGPSQLEATVRETQVAADPVELGVYTGFDGRYRLFGYCEKMPEALSAADLLISRSGATIVAEMTAVGRPAILVPLAINLDQAANAKFLESKRAALCVSNEGLRFELAGALAVLMHDTSRLEAMGQAARSLGKPDAARLVADEIMKLGGMASSNPD